MSFNYTERKFVNLLTNLMVDLRKHFAEVDLHHLNVTIDVDGPTMRDDLSIKFRVGTSRYDDGVEGNSVSECFAEMLRRKGWKKCHNPIAISYVSSDENPED